MPLSFYISMKLPTDPVCQYESRKPDGSINRTVTNCHWVPYTDHGETIVFPTCPYSSDHINFMYAGFGAAQGNFTEAKPAVNYLARYFEGELMDFFVRDIYFWQAAWLLTLDQGQLVVPCLLDGTVSRPLSTSNSRRVPSRQHIQFTITASRSKDCQPMCHAR